MAKISTKHKDREQSFFIKSFTDGLNQEVPPNFLPTTALSACKNMKYVFEKAADGTDIVILSKRQGTVKISNTALGSAVLSCTYYNAISKYIVATASKIYYLDASYDPVEIGDIGGIPTFTEFKGKLIIHDSGVTKAWNGSTLETLVNYYVDEIIETGDGVIVKFAGTLAHAVVVASSLSIEFTDTTIKTITDDGNGRLTGNVNSSVVKNITGATKATPCSITCVGHSYSTNDIVNIQSVGGMTEINNQSYTLTSTGVDTFTIPVDSSTYTTYTSGGTASINAIKYTNGAYVFVADGVPDTTTSVYATYKQAAGAPLSKAGFVRASRLYMWGDANNPSRIVYCSPNDEYAWDSSGDGGYIDIDPLDGTDLIGCLNFFETIVCVKGNSVHEINGFPDDADFAVVPLLDNTGSTSYKTFINDGGVISFLSKEGLITLTATEQYGDVTKGTNLSTRFRSNVNKYANEYCYSEFNQYDRQLWLTLFNSVNQLPYLYVINLQTDTDGDIGGQVSLYEFAFTHSCYKYVNNEMLIGGSDGHLYRLYASNERYKDNGVSYSADTYVKGAMTNWGTAFYRKHNKKLFPNIYGKAGTSCTLNIYADNDYDTPILTESITTHSNIAFIYEDGQSVLIYDMNSLIGAEYSAERGVSLKRKFNYKDIMFEITNIEGALGFDFFGMDFTGAIIGD